MDVLINISFVFQFIFKMDVEYLFVVWVCLFQDWSRCWEVLGLVLFWVVFFYVFEEFLYLSDFLVLIYLCLFGGSTFFDYGVYLDFAEVF